MGKFQSFRRQTRNPLRFPDSDLTFQRRLVDCRARQIQLGIGRGSSRLRLSRIQRNERTICNLYFKRRSGRSVSKFGICTCRFDNNDSVPI